MAQSRRLAIHKLREGENRRASLPDSGREISGKNFLEGD